MRNSARDDTFAAPLAGHLAGKVTDFVHPREVLADEELNPLEKRAVLAAWASDASAVESRPGFRWLPGTPGPVALEKILAALRTLDMQTADQAAAIAAMTRDGFAERMLRKG